MRADCAHSKPLRRQVPRPANSLLLAVLMIAVTGCGTQSTGQQADLDFEYTVNRPLYAVGAGPSVLIDEAHFNFHTLGGRYAPFANVLRADGYRVGALGRPASADTLKRTDIFVIANAIAESDQDDWTLPQEPAFTRAEVDAITRWVDEGGSLLLIADHMPFPGAMEDLAAAFGILFGNGFLYDADGESSLLFTSGTGLSEHPIIAGREEQERVAAVRTFTGQAFRVSDLHEPLLTIPPGSVLRLPVEAWEFSESTPQIPAAGMLQGAVIRHGEGRVAVFGEAAMFSAQETSGPDGREQMGMNRADAAQNAQFLLNVMHWLTGVLD